jgi:uncharacterized protein YndB with AHSA1/START domain
MTTANSVSPVQHARAHRGGRQDDRHPTLVFPSKEARDATLETPMKEGVSESWDRLAELLRSMS